MISPRTMQDGASGPVDRRARTGGVARVSIGTVSRFEAGQGVPDMTVALFQKALERAGAEFVAEGADAGVWLRRSGKNAETIPLRAAQRRERRITPGATPHIGVINMDRPAGDQVFGFFGIGGHVRRGDMGLQRLRALSQAPE